MEQRVGRTQLFDNTLNLAVICSLMLAGYILFNAKKQSDFPVPLQSQYSTVELPQLSMKEMPTYTEVSPLPVTITRDTKSVVQQTPTTQSQKANTAGSSGMATENPNTTLSNTRKKTDNTVRGLIKDILHINPLF